MDPTFIAAPAGRLAVYEQGNGQGACLSFFFTPIPARPASGARSSISSPPTGASLRSIRAAAGQVRRRRMAITLTKAAPTISPPWRMQETSSASQSSPIRAAVRRHSCTPRAILTVLPGSFCSTPPPIRAPFRSMFATISSPASPVPGASNSRSSSMRRSPDPMSTSRARVIADCEKVVAPARLGFGKAFAEWDPEAALDAWKGPLFILASEASDNGPALYRLRPHIPHEVVRGTGHWLQLDAPDIVAQAIRRFIARIETT